MCICPKALGFPGTAQRCVEFNLLDFYIWGHLKPLAYSARIENEETLHRRISEACQTIRNGAGTFEMVRQCVIRRVLV